MDLATEFITWLRARIREAHERGQSVTVFHYADPEPSHLVAILGSDEVSDVLESFVDLFPIIRRNFFGVAGLGIKKVAPVFGFHWRDADPGGLQSQSWLEQARRDLANSADLRARILDYNEDDVRATAAVRDGLRTLP